MTRVEGAALVYVGLPTMIFLAGWLVAPVGPVAAIAVAASLAALLLPQRGRWPAGPGMLWLPMIVIAGLWCLLSGLGHFVFANPDWVVRDAVLVDLVRDAWPVSYVADGHSFVLRAPIGYFLPAAVVGRLWGIEAAEQALLVWTVLGVVLTFALMLRDRPTLKAALIRIAIFGAFSGMDVVGTVMHFKPFPLGEHLEWWAFLFQYSSQTTQLFWVPNHALPGWIAIAWLLGQRPQGLAPATAVLFVLFAPIWSPLTAIGLAPIVGVAILRRLLAEPFAFTARAALDWRMLLPLVVTTALVFPYLVAGSDQVPSGFSADVPWVGEDFLPRYVEFVVLEFAGFAALLVARDRHDPLLWTAIAVLLLLPIFRFGPANDLAMRASIPPLTLLAIGMGRWLSTPLIWPRQHRRIVIGVLLLVIGAVTPLMEFARAFQVPAWPLDTRSSVVDVTRGAHYITSPDQPWLRRFLKPAGR